MLNKPALSRLELVKIFTQEIAIDALSICVSTGVLIHMYEVPFKAL